MEITQEITDLQKSSISVTLSSINSEGYPVMRNLLTLQEKMTPSVMYFSTNTSSSKLNDFNQNNKACVYMFDNETFRGINLYGTIEIIHDEDIKKFFFKDEHYQYYQKGPTDPDYTILKFKAAKAKGYENLRTYTYIF